MAHMKGNLPLAMKVENERFFQHFVGTPQTSFCAEIGKRIRIVQADVFLPEIELEGKTEEESEKVRRGAESQTICEIEVTRGKYCPKIFRLFLDSDEWLLFLRSLRPIVTDMCNVFGTLHGGCAAFLIDLCVLYLSSLSSPQQ